MKMIRITIIISIILLAIHLQQSIITTITINATLLSSSSIELCTRTSSNSSFYEPQNCNKKIVMTLAVDGGAGSTESILAWRTGTDSSDGKQYSTKDDQPVRITVKKSKPYFRYPLFYVRNFNARPQEQTIYTNLFDCHDSSFDASPTCGRAFDWNNQAIPYSEGFCCSCSACELFGFCTNADRGYTRCSLFGDAASASCLTFGDIWYSGYAMGQAETWYDITIDVEVPDNNTSSSSSSTSSSSKYSLSLGPDRLGAIDNSPNRDIFTARLVGDFSPFRQPLNLEDQLLFVPAAPQEHPRIANGNAEWLLVPNHKISTDGRECNKIGVSCEAFNSQGSRCDVQTGSCLRNQLEDLRNEDLKRLQDGLVPLYLASAKGTFVGYSSSSSPNTNNQERNAQTQSSSSSSPLIPSNLTGFFNRNIHLLKNKSASSPTSSSVPQKNRQRSAKIQSSSSSSDLFLAYEVEGIQASVITLTINADKVALSVNVASGKILFTNTTVIASEFAANSREGKFDVMWINTGDIVAQFYIGIDHCSEPSMRVLAETATAHPRQVQYNSFRVTSIKAGTFSCNITLQNALLEVVDTRRFSFFVNETKIDQGAQGGTGNGAENNGGEGNGAPGEEGNCGECAFYNPVCMIGNGCIWQFSLQGLGLLALAGLLGFLLYFFVLRKYCCSGSKKGSASSSSCCCGDSSSSDDDDKEQERKEKKKKEKEEKKRRQKRREEKERKKNEKAKQVQQQEQERKEKKKRLQEKKLEEEVENDQQHNDSSSSIVYLNHSKAFSSAQNSDEDDDDEFYFDDEEEFDNDDYYDNEDYYGGEAVAYRV